MFIIKIININKIGENMTDGMTPEFLGSLEYNNKLLEAREKYAKRIKLIIPQAEKNIRRFCTQICSNIGVKFDKRLEDKYDAMAKRDGKNESIIKIEKAFFKQGTCEIPIIQAAVENFINSIPMLSKEGKSENKEFSEPNGSFITTSIIVPKSFMEVYGDEKFFGKATQEHLTTEILFALQNKSVNNSGFTADEFFEELRRFKEYAIKKPQSLEDRAYVDVVAGTRMLTKSAIEAAKQMWPEQKEIFNSFDAELQGTGFYELEHEGEDESNHKAIDQFQLILDGALNANLDIESFYNRHGDELSNVYTSNTGHLEGIIKYIVNDKTSIEDKKRLITMSLQQLAQKDLATLDIITMTLFEKAIKNLEQLPLNEFLEIFRDQQEFLKSSYEKTNNPLFSRLLELVEKKQMQQEIETLRKTNERLQQQLAAKTKPVKLEMSKSIEISKKQKSQQTNQQLKKRSDLLDSLNKEEKLNPRRRGRSRK